MRRPPGADPVHTVHAARRRSDGGSALASLQDHVEHRAPALSGRAVIVGAERRQSVPSVKMALRTALGGGKGKSAVSWFSPSSSRWDIIEAGEIRAPETRLSGRC